MRKPTTRVVLLTVCTVCVVGIVAGTLAWHPWDVANGDEDGSQANSEGSSQVSQNHESEIDDSAKEDPVWVPGGTDDADFGIDGDGWVINGPSDSTFPDEATKEKWLACWHTNNVYRKTYGTKTVIEPESGAKYVAAELMVILEPGSDENTAEAAAKSVGGYVGEVRDFGDELMVRVCFDESASISEKESQISKAKGVTEASRNLVFDALDDVSYQPNDSQLSSQTYLDVSRFKQAWGIVRCQGATSIAILDTGVEAPHTELQANIDYDHSYDFYFNQPINPYSLDYYGHGTMVSGVASAVADNGEGIAGASFNAKLNEYVVMNEQGHIYSDLILDALRTIKDAPGPKPAAINMSFRSDIPEHYSAVVTFGNYVTELHNDGVVFVAAAGNDGTSELVFPACFDDVIGVGSVTDQGVHYAGSQVNETVDICTVGVNVLTTVVLFNTSQQQNLCLPATGTSLAAPQVAAAAALVKTAHPGYTAWQVEQALFMSAQHPSDMVDVTGPAGTPDGIDDSGAYGHGILDAHAAILQHVPSGGGPGQSPVAGGNLLDMYRESKE